MELDLIPVSRFSPEGRDADKMRLGSGPGPVALERLGAALK